MFEDLRFYVVYLALLSGICGAFYWRKLPGTKARLILYTVWFSALTEIVGTFFTSWTGLLNYCVFNIYILVTFILYIILLKALLKKLSNKRFASVLLAGFLIFYIINYLFIQNQYGQMVTNSYSVGVIILIVLSFLYLFELFSSNLILSYSKSVFFWFILGILIFHVPFLPFMLSLRWFLIGYDPSVYGLIIFFLNLLMNVCFILGFVCSEKKYNY